MDMHQAVTQSTLLQLMDMGRAQGRRPIDAWKFALAWLVGGMLAREGRLGRDIRLSSLVEPAAWTSAGIEAAAIAHRVIWGRQEAALSESALNRAVAWVAELYEQEPAVPWDLADYLWQAPGSFRDEPLPLIAPEVCDLLFASLGARKEETIWLPFDPYGQLLSRALKAGLAPITAGPWRHDRELLALIAALVESATSQDLRTDPETAADQPRDLSVDYLVACPPIGLRITLNSSWRQWTGEDAEFPSNLPIVRSFLGSRRLDMDKAETWAIASFWPRVRKRAAYLVSNSVLFARGQDARLRHALLSDDCPIESVITLPPRQLSTTSIQTALLVLHRGAQRESIAMIDAAEMVRESRHGPRAPKELDLDTLVGMLPARFPEAIFRHASTAPEPNPVEVDGGPLLRHVPLGDILYNDGNLLPSRYLKAPLNLKGERRSLGELASVIRAPSPARNATGAMAIEIGIPDLGGWRPVPQGERRADRESRTLRINSRKLEDLTLKTGDIVMSIKGTIGKIGFIEIPRIPEKSGSGEGDILPMVVSQNCIAIRERKRVLLPGFLYLYLRSSEFESQLRAITSGAVIPHVTPSDLMKLVQVPVPTPEEQRKAIEKYEQLCRLEAQVQELTERINNLGNDIWRSTPANELAKA